MGWKVVVIAGILGASGAAAWFAWNHSADRQSEAVVASKSESTSEARGEFIVAYGTIDIAEGTTHVSCPVGGIVDRVLVKEGQKVSAGDPLVVLESSVEEAQLLKAKAAVQESELQLAQAKSNAKQHELQLAQQRAVIDAADARLKSQQRELERFTNLGTAADDTVVEIERQKVVADKATAEVENLNLQQLKLEDPQRSIEVAQTVLEMARADLQAATAAVDQRTIKAPEDGLVLRVGVRAGEAVSPLSPEPLVWFVADDEKIIRCDVNHRYARRIFEGMKVLYFHDETDELLGEGIVVHRAPWIADQREIVEKPFHRSDQRSLECIIALTTQPERLWIGERVRVVIYTQTPSSTLNKTTETADASSGISR